MFIYCSPSPPLLKFKNLSNSFSEPRLTYLTLLVFPPPNIRLFIFPSKITSLNSFPNRFCYRAHLNPIFCFCCQNIKTHWLLPMARDSIQLPCDGDGACMRCKVTPPAEETLACSTCATPWHVACLASPPETLASTLQWNCPDCSGESLPSAAAAIDGSSSELFASIDQYEK